MESRDRVFAALAHREPDRVPIDMWATPAVSKRVQTHLGFSNEEQLFDHFDVDFRYIDGPPYVGPTLAQHDNGTEDDHWGVPRVKIEIAASENSSVYQEVVDFPLRDAKTLDEVRKYTKWPDPDWFDYDAVRRQVAEAREKNKVVVFMGDRKNRCAQLKPAMYLRGIDQILVDLALEPEIAQYIFRRVADFYLEYVRRTLEAADGGIDIFFMGDDFGTQKGLFMSPDMWRQFLRPGVEQFIALGKQFECRVAHHSCGSIKAIIPDLIDCGLDILNPIQPDVHDMDRCDLKRRFGQQLSFHGSISIQKTLPFGTPDDVRNEVKERFESLGPGGGFIFCTAHNIQADTPTENVVALFDAYREYGRYGRS